MPKKSRETVTLHLYWVTTPVKTLVAAPHVQDAEAVAQRVWEEHELPGMECNWTDCRSERPLSVRLTTEEQIQDIPGGSVPYYNQELLGPERDFDPQDFKPHLEAPLENRQDLLNYIKELERQLNEAKEHLRKLS